MKTLKGKTILITGASRGLGRALALQAAQLGAKVALNARNENELLKVAEEIKAKGGEAKTYAYDIADKNNIYPLLGSIQNELGPIDILVNNASTLGPTPLRPLMDSECEDFESVLQRNLLAPFRLSKAVLGRQLFKDQGVVVNLSSDAAVEAYPNWGFYSASKAALDHLTKIWAEELKEFQIKLFSFDPSEMNTQMHAKAIPDADIALLADPAHIAEDLLQLILNSSKIPSGSRLVARKWSN